MNIQDCGQPEQLKPKRNTDHNQFKTLLTRNGFIPSDKRVGRNENMLGSDLPPPKQHPEKEKRTKKEEQVNFKYY